MPELPEVEVVKKSLINKMKNLIVKAIKINDGRLRYKIDRNKMKKIVLTANINPKMKYSQLISTSNEWTRYVSAKIKATLIAAASKIKNKKVVAPREALRSIKKFVL